MVEMVDTAGLRVNVRETALPQLYGQAAAASAAGAAQQVWLVGFDRWGVERERRHCDVAMRQRSEWTRRHFVLLANVYDDVIIA